MQVQKSKIKNQNYILKFKNFRFYIITLIFTFYTLILPTSLSAQSPSATPSANIKEKLQELQTQIASKAAKLKQEVDKKLRDKAYVGIVKSKSASSLTLASKLGAKIVSVNQDTVYESRIKGKSKITLKTLSEGDYLAALGDIDETGVLIAKKVILLDPKIYNLPPKTYLWGQVMVVSEKLVTIKTNDKKNISVSLPKLTQVKLNEHLILIGTLNDEEIFEAEFVHKLPQAGVLNFKPKIATQSASASAKIVSPSAKPKSTPKP